MRFVIQRNMDGQYLMNRMGYWDRIEADQLKKDTTKWSPDLQKARVFTNVSSAKNAYTSAYAYEVIPVKLTHFGT